MSIDALDLIGLAQKLAEGDSECEWRSGVSRAYYAAYHKALDVAEHCLPPSPHATGVHRQLTDRYLAEGRKGASLAYKLIELKHGRTHADYELSKPFNQQDAAHFVAHASAFLPHADAFLASRKPGRSMPS